MLERDRAERAAEQAEWHERLRRADRLATFARLAATLAHQLGTPINVVAGRAAMIAADETASPGSRGNGKIIAEQAKRMTDMLREILDFARKRGIQRAATPLGAVLERARELVAPIAEARRVAIRVEPAGELATALDSERVLQVLTNVMMNAVDAMPGGGSLVLSAERRLVEQPGDDHAAPGEYVAVVVRDEGGGVDGAEPFRPPWQRPGARGISLYVCQGIAREHGGWIELAREPDRGGRVTLFVPHQPSVGDRS